MLPSAVVRSTRLPLMCAPVQRKGGAEAPPCISRSSLLLLLGGSRLQLRVERIETVRRGEAVHVPTAQVIDLDARQQLILRRALLHRLDTAREDRIPLVAEF